jgi:hypothetical protein
MGVRLEGVLKLAAVDVDGHTLSGLSALAWDTDDQVLYAVSDHGIVFHLIPNDDADGFLAGVRVLAAYPLRDERGRPLEGVRSDSEGVAIRNAGNGIKGDSELSICFERVPRILRYSPRGDLLGAVMLPDPLRDRRAYRRGNRGLESLAWVAGHGYITAPEQPLQDADERFVDLYALGSSMSWRYPLAAGPNAALTDMLALPDGSLLTLERSYGVFFIPFITTIRRIRTLPVENGATLGVQTVARFNTGQGWSLDNFEGLALQDNGRILMVSDDNARALQSTLLAAFRLLDTDASLAEASPVIEHGHDRSLRTSEFPLPTRP